MQKNRLVLSFCLAGGIAACSAGGSAKFAPPLAAPATVATRSVPSSTQIGGIINTTNWGVASGKTVNVASNLAVFASGTINIAGKLVVPRGISVAFFTPSFTISAPKGTIATAGNKKWKGPVDDLVSACQINLQDGTSWTVGAGDNLGFTSSSKINPAKPCTLTVGYPPGAGAGQPNIVMQPGAPGGYDAKHSDGQDGGAIVIGTSQAISITQALAKKDKHATLKAYAPAAVVLHSPLVGANGGNGKPDPSGTAYTGGISFTGWDGGIGGWVQIVAGTIASNFSGDAVIAGNGGAGGTIGQSFAYEDPNPLDGTATSPNGLDGIIHVGNGGGGGLASVKAKMGKGFLYRGGNGGTTSSVYSITSISGDTGAMAGSGYHVGYSSSAAVTTTGNGGSLTVYLGAVGKKGIGGNDKKNRPKNGKYTVFQVGGGNGSATLAGPPFTPGTGAPGGTGGDLILIPPPHVTIATLKQEGLQVQAYLFGSGGSGVKVCNSTAGYNGGNAGVLQDNGLAQFVKYIEGNFAGGDGSGGTPPGAGGKGGVDDEGTSIGPPGAVGRPC